MYSRFFIKKLLTDFRKVGIIFISAEHKKQNKIKFISFLLCDLTHRQKKFTIGELIMFVKDVMVQNKVGLHARPATFFIQKANEFKSSIWIEKEERRVNAKSLLGILSLGIVGGTEIKVIADGSDEQAAVNALVDLVSSGFSDDNR